MRLTVEEIIEIAARHEPMMDVCLHCGHPTLQHIRRGHGVIVRYSCHYRDCTCTYELFHAE